MLAQYRRSIVRGRTLDELSFFDIEKIDSIGGKILGAIPNFIG